MQRREFLAALPLLIAAGPTPPRARVLAIARAADTGGNADRGVRFGVHEAGRTAQLLGRELRWLEERGTSAAATVAEQGAELILALGDVGTLPAGAPPVLRVPLAESDRSSCGTGEWSVGPALEQRREVLATYRAAHPQAPASLRALAWVPALEKYGAQQLNERYAAFTGSPLDEAAWLGWIAARIALECALRGAPAAQLAAPRFAIDAHKGEALRFDAATRRLRQPLYVVDAARPGALPLAELTPEPLPGLCTTEPGIRR